LGKHGHFYLFEEDTRENAFQGLDMSNDLKQIPMMSNQNWLWGFFGILHMVIHGPFQRQSQK
jgi:hypothetical protein